MHPNDGRVVSNFIVQALRNEPLTIYGDGLQSRPFCYVDDMMEAFVRFMATADDVTGPINLGNPVECTIQQLAEQVIQLTGATSTIIFKPLPHDDPIQRKPDTTLAQEKLDWTPEIKLDFGLTATIACFKDLLHEQKIL